MPRPSLPLALVILSLVLSACAGVFGSDAAATVNGHDIAMSTYDQQFAYKRALSAQSLGMDVCTISSTAGLCKQLKRSVLTDLINQELIRQYADAHSISVSNADIARQWSVVYRSNFHDDQRVLKAYTQRYHVDVAYLKSLQGQDLLQQRVEYAVTRTMPSAVPAVRLSQFRVANEDGLRAAQAQLRGGATLVSLAAPQLRIKGSVCQTQGCGEMGWIPVELLPSQERKAATAPVGSILGPFVTQNSLILIQVEGHTNQLPLNAIQTLNLRRQLFAGWLSEQAKHANIDRHAAT